MAAGRSAGKKAAKTPATEAIRIGGQLGPYQIQELEGKGAFGVVYRAYHPGLDRMVAIKLLQAGVPSPDAVGRFRLEARAIARLRHRHIVEVHDFGEVGGVPYMIVEYVAGGSLLDRLRASEPIDRDSELAILLQIAGALDYAHGEGVLHCDVKPANILMLHDGDGILADFGLARLTGSMDDTESGVSSGTPSYMSPEQVNAEKPGPGTDQYALAVIAYQLLCGVLPFTGNVIEVMTAQVKQEPAPPSSHDPRLPAATDSVILRGLAKSPGERWDSCAGFVHALLEALRQPAAVPPPAPIQPATSLPGDSSWRPAGWQPEEWSE